MTHDFIDIDRGGPVPLGPGLDAFLEEIRFCPPKVAIVLGSGLGALARHLQVSCSTSFQELPGLALPAVAGHAGQLVLGQWQGQRVLLFEGRLHYYEGHPWCEVVAPIRIAHFLGARVLLLTNASGGIHDDLQGGCLMALRDHIEWARPHAWRHPGSGGLGPPRPAPYSSRLLALLDQAARALGGKLHQGIYASLTGPNYETPAEIRALKICGADAVGMSTAREIQAGFDLGLECAALSCIANRAAGLGPETIDHSEVLKATAAAGGPLGDLIGRFLALL
jgi:purine-nucleoside phosphorylase